MPVAQAIPPAGEAPAAYQKKGKIVSKELDTTVADLKEQIARMGKKAEKLKEAA